MLKTLKNTTSCLTYFVCIQTVKIINFGTRECRECHTRERTGIHSCRARVVLPCTHPTNTTMRNQIQGHLARHPYHHKHLPEARNPPYPSLIISRNTGDVTVTVAGGPYFPLGGARRVYISDPGPGPRSAVSVSFLPCPSCVTCQEV